MKKILIIEDEVVLSSTLADNLIHEGFKVIQVKDGEEGLAVALREKPDLILLDILLPTMNGFTILRKLRKDSQGKNIPVIIMSNLEQSGVAASIGDDVHEYMVKSDWKLDDVIKKIKEKLEPV